MPFTNEDRNVITDLISMHGHLTDRGELDRLSEVFSDDVIYDVSDLGGTAIGGLDSLIAAAVALGDNNPIAHHVTNVVVSQVDEDHATALSKGLGINADGTIGSVTYEDLLERTDLGWRITHRSVRLRRTPLQP